MRDERDLWNEIEAAVDRQFEQEDHDEGPEAAHGGPSSPDSSSPDSSPLDSSPLDGPIESSLGELIGRALDSRGRLGLQSGDQVGPYRIEGVIGEGGMGTVFAARRVDGNFDQDVALKVLHRSPADEDARLRFVQERQILAGLRHPHIARLLDGGVVRGMPYLVMERVAGLPVTDFCRLRRLGPEERIRLILQACDAIRYAHRQGVVHRDLKPSNLLVESGPAGEARIVVLDFGIALIENAEVPVTSTGQIFGTPGYMSPEQAIGDRHEIDRRTDVYSLGVILYELLSGHRPYEGSNRGELLEQLIEGEPVPLGQRQPNVPIDLATITDTCVAREPARRYASVRALAEDLESYLDGGPIAARPEGILGRLVRRARQRPKIAALIAGATAISLVSLLLLAVMAVRYTRDLRRERNAAVEARADAEGLIQFMLEDLHAGLDRVGRLDLLEAVADKSVDYYANRPVADTPESIRGRGAALFNAGDVLADHGDIGRALEAYEQNRRFYADLATRDPSPRWTLELARSHGALARAFDDQGDAERSLDHASASLDLTRALGEIDPPPAGWAEVHFETLSHLGWITREAESTEQSRAILDEAIAFAAAQAHSEAGDANSDGGTGIDGAPTAAETWTHRQAVALSYRGLAEQQAGDLPRALASFGVARELCSALVEADPANTVFREELQLVLGRIGSAHYDLGDLDRTVAVLREAQRQAEILVGLEPANAGWQRELSVAHATMAAAHRERGDLESARRDIESSLAISRALTGRFPDNRSSANDLAWDLLDLGRIERGRGALDAARSAWEEAVGVMRRVRDDGADSAYYLDTEVQALLELGRIEEARPLVEQLVRADWQTPDFLELCAAHGLVCTAE